MTDSIPTLIASDCLGRTCLQWQPDGELTALDLCLVLDRLALVDAEVLALVEQTPCAGQLPPDGGRRSRDRGSRVPVPSEQASAHANNHERNRPVLGVAAGGVSFGQGLNASEASQAVQNAQSERIRLA